MLSNIQDFLRIVQEEAELRAIHLTVLLTSHTFYCPLYKQRQQMFYFPAQLSESTSAQWKEGLIAEVSLFVSRSVCD